MSKATRLPIICPSCETSLNVAQLACPSCSTAVSGNFPLPVFLQLTADEQEFILKFFLTSGSIKEVAAQIGNSYPTVRNRLDDLIDKVKQLQQAHE